MTQWNLENFRGLGLGPTSNAPELFEIGGDPHPDYPDATYLNRLTVLNMTSELDDVILYCGTGAQPRQANFTLKIYRKSKHIVAATSYNMTLL